MDQVLRRQVLRRADPGGRLTISERVVAKIAAQGAAELTGLGVGGASLVRFGRTESGTRRPSVDVVLAGALVSLTVECGLPFPVDVKAATEELRRGLRAHVTHLTGLEVGQVDITVGWLQPVEDAVTSRRLL